MTAKKSLNDLLPVFRSQCQFHKDDLVKTVRAIIELDGEDELGCLHAIHGMTHCVRALREGNQIAILSFDKADYAGVGELAAYGLAAFLNEFANQYEERQHDNSDRNVGTPGREPEQAEGAPAFNVVLPGRPEGPEPAGA